MKKSNWGENILIWPTVLGMFIHSCFNLRVWPCGKSYGDGDGSVWPKGLLTLWTLGSKHQDSRSNILLEITYFYIPKDTIFNIYSALFSCLETTQSMLKSTLDKV